MNFTVAAYVEFGLFSLSQIVALDQMRDRRCSLHQHTSGQNRASLVGEETDALS